MRLYVYIYCKRVQMNLRENINESIRSIKSSLLRTVLTASIIAIGITSLVSILTAVDALNASIDTSFASLGANTFDIKNKRMDGRVKDGVAEKIFAKLKLSEIEEFKDKYQDGVVSIHTFLSGNAEVKRYSKITNPNIRVRGVDEKYMVIREYDIENGRNFTELDIRYNVNYVLLGSEVVKELFDKNEDPVNQLISLRGTQFKVVGVLKEKGGLGGDKSADRTVFMPIGTAVRLANYHLDYYITASNNDPSRKEVVIGEATGLMRKIRKDPIGDEDSFEISNNKTLNQELDEIFGMVKIGGAAIASIILLGASIALMNIMLVSVTERTREIGVRKAIGATAKKIRLQFLIEAIAICIMGGIAGVIIGLIVGNIISLLLNTGKFVAPWEWIFGGLFVCVVVGIISGIYPAIKASKLDPIESLRYE